MKNKFTLLTIVLLSLISFPAYQNVNELNISFSEDIANKSDSIKSLETQLLPVVNQSFKELQVPGAIIGVWMNGYEPFKNTLGVADLKTNQPITLNDKMRIGSITKTFTGTVLLQLVDEGKIKLSDKLSTYFPDFPNGQNITIEEIGNMTSGIYNYTEDSTFDANLMKNLTKPYTPEDLVNIALKHNPSFDPGKGFQYSNTNFILLGLIIEKITGNSIGSEIQNRILNPLGMTNSTFATDATFPDPHAHGYMYMDSLATPPADVTTLDPSSAWSAGAMISTLDDLSKYAKPLATGELISKKTQAERLKWSKSFIPQSGAWKDRTLYYGFAIADFNGAIGHNGEIPGFNAFMGYIPEKDATIIVLVNMEGNQKGIGPADYIARQIISKVKEM